MPEPVTLIVASYLRLGIYSHGIKISDNDNSLAGWVFTQADADHLVAAIRAKFPEGSK